MQQIMQRTIGRRRFVGVAAATGAGVAGLALVGCGGDDDDDDDSEPTAGTATSAATTVVTQTEAPAETETEAPAETETGTPEATATAAAGNQQRGGHLVLNAALDTVDTFDSHRARFGPMAYIFGPSMSRLVEYKDPDGFELGGDLAESWEQGDELTITFTLKPNIMWQDKPPVNGRALTVDDIVYYVERQKAGVDKDGVEDPTFYRKAPMSQVARVDTPDESTVVFNMTEPDATFYDVLASPWNFVMAQEAVDTFTNDEWLSFDPKTVIGTGPFALDSFARADTALFSRVDNYYDQGIPYMDGIKQLNTLGDPATGEAAFRQKQIDNWGSPAPTITESLLADEPDVNLIEYGVGNPVLSTFATTTPPWNDPRLMQAINRAYDRQQIIQQLHSGLGRGSSNVFWPLAAWALPQEELQTLPGYLRNKEEDFTEARALWQAAGGPDSLTLTLPDIWASVYPATAEVVPTQLSEALGISISSEIKTYVQITQGLVDKSLSFWFGWGNPYDTPDPRATLFRAYHSTGSENQWGTNQPGGVQIPGLDDNIANARITLDNDEAREIVFDIQRQLIEFGGGGIQIYYNYIGQSVNWPYLKEYRVSAVYFAQDMKNWWIDQTHPTYQGRPDPV
jgi:peptide/nickel transport system substrate-binding protein